MIAATLIGALIGLGSVPGHCFAAARDLPVGSVLTVDDVTATPCMVSTRRAPLRYDRVARAPVVATAIPAGTYLGRLAPLVAIRIDKDQRLTLRSSSGPVVIEREVVAVQPGSAGARIFVRDASGQVFSVRVGEIRP